MAINKLLWFACLIVSYEKLFKWLQVAVSFVTEYLLMFHCQYQSYRFCLAVITNVWTSLAEALSNLKIATLIIQPCKTSLIDLLWNEALCTMMMNITVNNQYNVSNQE